MGKQLVDPNRLCIGCMKILEQPGKPCPTCGFSLQSYQRPAGSIPPYEILNGKYLVGKVIGIGGFGITYIGWDFYQSRRICIKEYFPKGLAARDGTSTQYSTCSMDIYTVTQKAQVDFMGGLKNYIKEAENLSRFYAMPGIVSVRDFFYGNRTAYIIMEYIDGINLKQYARTYPSNVIPPQILFPMMKDVLKALAAVHKEDIIHRDISPDNIMINQKLELKLIDFGAAKEYTSGRDDKVFLKHGYAPLEQYDRHGKMGPWTDVYSISASIYYLLSGQKVPRAYERIQQDKLLPLQALGVPVSDGQDQAIRKGLGVLIEDRYQDITELCNDLYQGGWV